MNVFNLGDIAYDANGLGYVEVESIDDTHYKVQQVKPPFLFDRIRITEAGSSLIRPWWGDDGGATFWRGAGD